MKTTALLATVASFAVEGQAMADASVAAQAFPTGAVLVSHDGRYQPLLGAGVLRKGERLMVLKGGHAALTYADGCKVNLKAGSMATIGAVAPCAGAGAAFRPVQGDVTLPVFGTVSTAELVAGVIVTGAIIGGSLAASGTFDSDQTPSSP